MILHIPHSSTVIPFKDGYVIDEALLNQEINLLTEWFTNELFENENATIVKAEFLRIFCDVERFADDSVAFPKKGRLPSQYIDDRRIFSILLKSYIKINLLNDK